MTGAETLLALAERCEHEQPSRDLDVAIAITTGWTCSERKRPGEAWWRSPVGVYEAIPPLFTLSLDAAVTLINSDLTAWRVGRGSIAWAVVCIGGYGDASQMFTVQASTPAAALCAAAMRARHAMQDEMGAQGNPGTNTTDTGTQGERKE